MKYVQRKFNTYTHTLSFSDIGRFGHKGLVVCIGVAFMAYLFLVSSTIFNGVSLKGVEQENKHISSRVSELELSYLSESKKLDMSKAFSLGFHEIKNPVFVSRDGSGKALSFASNE